MVIKKKGSKLNYIQTDIDEIANESMVNEIINRGGKTTADENTTPNPAVVTEEEVRFTLRIPSGMIKEIDAAKKPRIGNISRNQWILEAIDKALKQDRH